MVQEDKDKTLDIVLGKTLVDVTISSKSKVAIKNGVHVASVIPASFFSYDKSSTAQVSGVVFLKLAEGRRLLAVEIDSTSTAPHAPRVLQSAAGDQESAFAMEVQLKKNEFGVDMPILMVLSTQSWSWLALLVVPLLPLSLLLP